MIIEKEVKDLEKGDTIILSNEFTSWTVKVVGLIIEESKVRDVVVKIFGNELKLMSMYTGYTDYGYRDIKDNIVSLEV